MTMRPHARIALLLPAIPAVLRARKPEILALQGASLGAQLRRRRHELHLRRIDVARMLGTSWKSLMWWQQDAREPFARSYPAIIRFLGREPWPEPETLPERLLAERRRRGFTIQEAADAAGVDYGTYWRWESGEWTPQPRSLPRITDFLRRNPCPMSVSSGACA